MFELVFLFTGLCGYALDPAASGGIAEGLDVVLPHADDHEAVLVVDRERIEEEGTTVEFVEDCDEEHVHCRVDLDRKIVRLRRSEVNGETQVTWDELSGSPECPDADNARSYGWTVPMSVVTPGEGRVRDELRSPGRRPPEHFGSLIQLENGHLSNVHFSRYAGQQIVRWRFGRGPWRSRIRRALGDRVELRQEGWQEDVVIEIVDVESRTVELLRLTPPPPCEDHERPPVLLIEIFNTPPEDRCAGAPFLPEPTTAATSDLTNDHFTFLYRLLPEDAVESTPKADDGDRCGDLPELEPDIRCAVSCLDPATAPDNPYCPGADVSGP